MRAKGEQKIARIHANVSADARANSALNMNLKRLAWSPWASALATSVCLRTRTACFRLLLWGFGGRTSSSEALLLEAEDAASSAGPSPSSSSSRALLRMSLMGVLIILVSLRAKICRAAARIKARAAMKMYATEFVDHELKYGGVGDGESDGSGPHIANGIVTIGLNAYTGITRALDTRRCSDRTLDFTGLSIAGSISTTSRSLHLDTGVYRMEADVSTSDVVTHKLGVDVFALRHAPESVMQTIDLDGNVDVSHEVSAPSSIHIEHAELAVRELYSSTVPCLMVTGHTLAGDRVAYVCMYISATGGALECVGGLKNQTSDRVECTIRTTDNTRKVHLLHTIIHGASATTADTVTQATRLFRSGLPASACATIARTTHALRWSQIWKGDLVIEKRVDATDEHIADLKNLNIHIKTSMYTLYSAMRDPGALLSRWIPLTRSMVPDAAPMSSLLAVPAMLSLTPWIMWLQPPTERATTWTPLYAVSRALIDSWHGYRATLDRPRLDLLYQTLRQDVAEMDLRIAANGVDASIGAAQTLRAVDVDDDALSCGLARRAFYAADQMSNTLRVPSDPTWSVKRDSIEVPRQTPFTMAIAETPAGISDGLMLLHPALLDVYAGVSDLGNVNEVMVDNSPYLRTVAEAALDPEVPDLTLACICALAADARRLGTYSDTSTRADEMYDLFMQRVSEGVDPMWGASGVGSRDMAAGIVACIMFGFLGMRFQGYVTRDGYHTVPAKLVSGPSVMVLPGTWYAARRKVSESLGQRVERLTQNSRASADPVSPW